MWLLAFLAVNYGDVTFHIVINRGAMISHDVVFHVLINCSAIVCHVIKMVELGKVGI